MSVSALPIIKLKTSIPSPRGSILQRVALLDRLRASTERRPVVAIVAPAGFGKTVVASQIARSWDGPVGWVSLDRSDSGPEVLWSLVAAAMQGPTVDEPTLSSVSARERATRRLLAEPDTLLVIDDVHQLDAAMRGELGEVIDRLTGHVTFVLTSRVRDALPITRPLGRGDVVFVSPSELSFDSQDLTAMIELERLELASDDIDGLLTITEGWPAGVQLALYGRRADPEAPVSALAASGEIGVYLDAEVLAPLPSEVRRVLVTTSMFERWTPELVRHAIDDVPDDIVDHLEGLRPFLVELDSDGPWFRLHSLVWDHLRAEANRTIEPDELAGVRRRGADWYARHRHVDDAMELFLEVGDHRSAARLLSRSTSVYRAQERLPVLRTWFSQLPDEVQHDAEVAVGLAWAMITTEGPREAMRWCERVERLTDPRTDVRASIFVVRSFAQRVAWLHDDSLESAEHAIEAASHHDSQVARTADLMALNQCIEIGLWRNDSDRCLDLMNEVEHRILRDGHILIEGRHPAQRALALVRAGLVDDAVSWIDESRRTAKRLGLDGTDIVAEGEVANAFIAIERGRFTEAAGSLKSAVAVLADSHHPTSYVIAAIELVRVLSRIDLSEATSHLDALLAARYRPEPILDARLSILLATLRFVEGRHAEALRSVNDALARQDLPLDVELDGVRLLCRLDQIDEARRRIARVSPDTGEGVRLSIGYIMLYSGLLGGEDADVHLTAAVSRAESVGLIGSLAEDLQLLRCTGVVVDPGPIMFERIRRYETACARLDPTLAELLSVRELEVLRHLAGRETQPEIARQLFISRNTLKSHLKSLYRKLGVASRREAADLAERSPVEITA